MLAEDVQKDESMLICIKRYLTLTAQHCDQEKIRSVLDYFHRPETVQALYAAIAENKNPLDRFALHCDMQCQSSCLLYGACKKKHTDALAKIITTKLQEMDRTALEEQFEQLLT
jgi:hypothetical protein